MARTERNRNVRGQVEAATTEGFMKIIDKADALHDEGFVLAGVVNLVGGPKARALGAVFVRAPKKPGASLVGE